ncbi:MAG: monovalent cation/H(+) antiporter subunit G [Actinomycetota bacterium]
METAGAIIVLIGSCFTLLSAVGLHRFNDVFARMHAAGKASTLGLDLILLGVGLRFADDGTFAKLFLAGVLSLIAVPAGVHLIGRAAHRAGTEVGPDTVVDELEAARRLRAAAEE